MFNVKEEISNARSVAGGSIKLTLELLVSMVVGILFLASGFAIMLLPMTFSLWWGLLSVPVAMWFWVFIISWRYKDLF